VTSFQYAEPTEPITEPNFQIELQHAVMENLTGLMLRPTIAMVPTPDSKNRIFTIECVFIFSIEEGGQFLVGEEIKFPKAFYSHIIGIAISTMRGLIPGKLSSTALADLFVPLINTEGLIPSKPFIKLPDASVSSTSDR
jgi:hypothetical protein